MSNTINNNKDFLDDGLSNDELRKTIKKIREYIEKGGNVPYEDRVKQLELDNVLFKERYPVLFEMTIREHFDYKSLNYFLDMRENLINDNITHEELSKKIGKDMFNKYVDVDKLNKKEKKN